MLLGYQICITFLHCLWLSWFNKVLFLKKNIAKPRKNTWTPFCFWPTRLSGHVGAEFITVMVRIRSPSAIWTNCLFTFATKFPSTIAFINWDGDKEIIYTSVILDGNQFTQRIKMNLLRYSMIKSFVLEQNMFKM